MGKRLKIEDAQGSRWMEIVGVAGDVRYDWTDEAPEFTIYRPFTQNYSALASLIVRTDGDPRGLISAVRREVATLDENLPPQNLQPLSESVSLASWSARTGAAVLGVFGLLGLVLAAIGIYGVMS